MRRFRVMVFLSVLFLPTIPLTTVDADLGDFLKGLQIPEIGGGQGLGDDRIVQGLKEALEIGSKRAIERVGRPDGYFGSPSIRIPLPQSLQKVEKGLRAMGYGDDVDSFVKSMNRAAERAAPGARDLLWDAVRAMRFEDARRILSGRDNEATLYLKEKTHDQLGEMFEPIVHRAMADVDVTRRYQALETKVRALPFVGDALGLDLDQYVTNGALDGLFLILEGEERKIRQDPAARATDLLKEVFGSRD